MSAFHNINIKQHTQIKIILRTELDLFVLLKILNFFHCKIRLLIEALTDLYNDEKHLFCSVHAVHQKLLYKIALSSLKFSEIINLTILLTVVHNNAMLTWRCCNTDPAS